ncbi:MAG: DEAD/DEAH box helicase [Clostridia bacterium]|nr:DEAD/DEAH box helicase [Clostridia bacterium]
MAGLLSLNGKCCFVDEGTGNHPADYEFHALAPAGLLSEEEKIVPLSDYSGDMFEKLLQYKIYDFLPWETEKPLMLDKWRQFIRNSEEDTAYVFNCVLLQNPMCETMMRFGFPEENSENYIREIADIIRPMDPVVIYLKNTDIAASVKKAAGERPGWLEAVIDYHVSGGYGKSIHVEGFEGYIRCLEDRQERELRILSRLNVKNLVLNDPQKDWTSSLDIIDEFLLNSNRKQIQTSCEDLNATVGIIKSIFASKKSREKAEKAYEYLSYLKSGAYGTNALSYIEKVRSGVNTTDAQAWEDFSNDSIGFIGIIEKISPDVLGADKSVYGIPQELVAEIRDQCLFPNGLLCDLRGYQEWGVKYILHQEKVLLGDEMGLGKTVQAIAAMVSLRNTGATHFVVVCPASVLTNWCREIESKSLLKVHIIHGSERKNAFEEWVKKGGVAVTTYEMSGHLTLGEKARFSMLIVDEAHYVKNPNARRTRNVKNLCKHADRILFMTGTALENNVEEMISLIRILNQPLADGVRNKSYISFAPQFRKDVAPVYYRRKREDVLTELPEKIESLEWCSLTKEEEKIYDTAILNRKFNDARRASWSVKDISKSSKGIRLLEIVKEAESDGRKVLVFSFYLDTLKAVISLLQGKCTDEINGSVSPERRQEIIDAFDKAPAGTVLPAQIMSGGTGLNIQSASVVIICEPQLKPSIENQAVSRAYRMGQSRNVLVYRLLSVNTVDERITELLNQKQNVFDAFADKSSAAEGEYSINQATIDNIINKEIDRIKAKRESE